VSDSSAPLLLTGNSSEVRFLDVPTWSIEVLGLGESAAEASVFWCRKLGALRVQTENKRIKRGFTK
jgi:hypothetical protein